MRGDTNVLSELSVEAFDATAAGHYADLVSERESAGRPISVADARIAAICRKRGATLATGKHQRLQGHRDRSSRPVAAVSSRRTDARDASRLGMSEHCALIASLGDPA